MPCQERVFQTHHYKRKVMKFSSPNANRLPCQFSELQYFAKTVFAVLCLNSIVRRQRTSFEVSIPRLINSEIPTMPSTQLLFAILISRSWQIPHPSNEWPRVLREANAKAKSQESSRVVCIIFHVISKGYALMTSLWQVVVFAQVACSAKR